MPPPKTAGGHNTSFYCTPYGRFLQVGSALRVTPDRSEGPKGRSSPHGVLVAFKTRPALLGSRFVGTGYGGRGMRIATASVRTGFAMTEEDC